MHGTSAARSETNPSFVISIIDADEIYRWTASNLTFTVAVFVGRTNALSVVTSSTSGSALNLLTRPLVLPCSARSESSVLAGSPGTNRGNASALWVMNTAGVRICPLARFVTVIVATAGTTSCVSCTVWADKEFPALTQLNATRQAARANCFTGSAYHPLVEFVLFEAAHQGNRGDDGARNSSTCDDGYSCSISKIPRGQLPACTALTLLPAKANAASGRTAAGLSVRAQLEHLGVQALNYVTLAEDDQHEFPSVARPVALQAEAFALPGVDFDKIVSSKVAS